MRRKKEMLAHELAHYFTGSLYKPAASEDEIDANCKLFNVSRDYFLALVEA